MDNIKTSFILDPTIQQPFLGPSLAFIQNASKEVANAAARAAMGDYLYGLSNSVGIVLTGGALSGTAGTDTISDSYIFWADEIYFVPGQTGLNAMATGKCYVESLSYAGFDPTQFSDGISRNVHQYRHLQISNIVSGSGLFDFANREQVQTAITTAANLNSWAGTIKYWKDKEHVYLKGTAQKNPVDTTAIFTLPAALRPTTAKTMAVMSVGGGAYVGSVIQIATNGNVTIDPAGMNANSTIYLDGIRFYKDW